MAIQKDPPLIAELILDLIGRPCPPRALKDLRIWAHALMRIALSY